MLNLGNDPAMLRVGNLWWWSIDPHVHLRGEEWGYKANVEDGILLALSQGVGLVFDMPNLPRPVTNRQRVYDRLALVPKDLRENHRLYVGLTGSEEQLLEALWCYYNIPQVIGFKMFAGKSVGDLSVTDRVAQRLVYRVLAREKFRGVLALHCEHEEYINPRIWNPANPQSHCWARPEVAENASAADQFAFALAEHYLGKMHICHVSSTGTVRLVDWAKSMGLQASCGLTPQHAVMNLSAMMQIGGIIQKVNPPLRPIETVLGLRDLLLAGRIDLIETDHAPHSEEEKTKDPYLSGIPSMLFYRWFVQEFLPSLGLSALQIKALTRDRALEIFGDKLAA